MCSILSTVRSMHSTHVRSIKNWEKNLFSLDNVGNIDNESWHYVLRIDSVLKYTVFEKSVQFKRDKNMTICIALIFDMDIIRKYCIYSIKRPGALAFSKRGAIIRIKISHLIKGLWVAFVILFNQNVLDIVISDDCLTLSCVWATPCLICFPMQRTRKRMTPSGES